MVICLQVVITSFLVRDELHMTTLEGNGKEGEVVEVGCSPQQMAI